ncbi:hypothetical protein EDB84DRAFT_549949 [Lactarius hengduanensis]|nr:hypothetical protein EDB84DRAFT_549949 [Lactarius hengduanensis]
MWRTYSPQHSRTVTPMMTDHQRQYDNIASPDSSPGTGTSSTMTHGPCKSLKIEMARTDESNRHVATIDILPDDIFLEIFAICLSNPYEHPAGHMRLWQRLVHVCQRWRQIIYGSPRNFDLHLYCSNCSNGTSFGEGLSLWPEFPLILEYCIMEDQYDLIAALEDPDRVRRVDLIISSPEVVEVVAAMEAPFPALTHLELTGPEEDRLKDMLYLSDFLGGSAPCLQHLSLEAVDLLDLPGLLQSARDLVFLRLENIFPFSPEEIVGGLVGLTKLRTRFH